MDGHLSTPALDYSSDGRCKPQQLVVFGALSTVQHEGVHWKLVITSHVKNLFLRGCKNFKNAA